MTTEFRHQGFTIDYAPQGVSLVAGELVALGPDGMVGQSAYDIPDGELGALHIDGVIRCPSGGAVLAAGDRVDLDTSASVNNGIATANVAGVHVVVSNEEGGIATTASDTHVFVKINVFL